jgi:hypothetical protein
LKSTRARSPNRAEGSISTISPLRSWRTVGADVQDDRIECSILGHAKVGAVLVLAHTTIWGSPLDNDLYWHHHQSGGARRGPAPAPTARATAPETGVIVTVASGASFVVKGAAQASDSALVAASAEMKWMNGWSASATFEGEFSDVTESYAGKGVVRCAW